jgi:hypothetical protein
LPGGGVQYEVMDDVQDITKDFVFEDGGLLKQ